jgi:hypothetical protein
LIFYVDRITNVQRLCIPSNVIKAVFAIAHSTGHPGFQRCYQIITSSWYVHSLTRQLREYVRHCPECLILTLGSILAPPLSTKEAFEAAMSVTCKSRRE